MSVLSRKREWKRNLEMFYQATGQAGNLPTQFSLPERLLAQKLTRRLYWFRRYVKAIEEGKNDEALRCEQLAEQALSLGDKQTESEGT